MYALRALREVQNIKGVSEEFKHEDRGELSIGTTHTQARYVLPAVIQKFCEQYPDVKFHLHQGTSEQIAEMGKLVASILRSPPVRGRCSRTMCCCPAISGGAGS